MWALTRLREFHRAYQSADTAWNRAAAVAELQFAQGLIFSCLLATPFWTAVGIFVHHITK
jgi:hypothetical protein